MSISAVRPDLNRFLEIKKAAEGRLSGSSSPAAGSAKSSGASFMDIIKAFRTTAPESLAEAAAPAARKTETAVRKVASPEELASVARAELARRKTGLLSVYGSGSRAAEGQSDIENAIRKRNLGNLFDAVA